MKSFAFAECQLHLNERSHILCDYKHWSSFGELSAVTLTMLISADACITSDEDQILWCSSSVVVIFFSLLVTHLMEKIINT